MSSSKENTSSRCGELQWTIHCKTMGSFMKPVDFSAENCSRGRKARADVPPGLVSPLPTLIRHAGHRTGKVRVVTRPEPWRSGDKEHFHSDPHHGCQADVTAGSSPTAQSPACTDEQLAPFSPLSSLEQPAQPSSDPRSGRSGVPPICQVP